jgi:penicillin amidase
VVRKFWFLALSVAVAVLACTALLVIDLRLRSASSRLPERGAVVERVAGCPSPAEILFDARGIAHVRAQDESTLWFALGYLHARDRFFQMDMARRTAERLSELIGPKGLQSDRSMRPGGRGQRRSSPRGWQRSGARRSRPTPTASTRRWRGTVAGSRRTWLTGRTEPWAVEDCLSLGLLLPPRHVSPWASWGAR